MWAKVESGAIEVHTVESSEPSPFSHAILSGRPFTYLDDAPLEERRTRGPVAAPRARPARARRAPGARPTSSPPLDPDAVAVVLEQVRPRPRERRRAARPAALAGRGAARRRSGAAGSTTLAADGRAGLLDGCWVATERRPGAEALGHDDDAAAACVAGHLQLAGPVTVEELVGDAPLPAGAPNGRTAEPRRGRAPRWPGSRRGARPSSCPTAAGAPATCWSACTAPAAAAAAAWSTPSPSPTTCASSRGGSTRRPAPARGPGRPARGARAAAGDRGAGGGVGGADPAGPRRGLRPALARRALPLGRGRLGPAHPAGRAARAAAARRRRPPRWPSSCATTS